VLVLVQGRLNTVFSRDNKHPNLLFMNGKGTEESHSPAPRRASAVNCVRGHILRFEPTAGDSAVPNGDIYGNGSGGETGDRNGKKQRITKDAVKNEQSRKWPRCACPGCIYE
jgi:hypothetical protein